MRQRVIYRPSYWLDQIENEYGDAPKVVICGLRYLTDVEWIQSHGGILINIHRETPLEGEDDNHISEIELDDFHGWHYSLDNNDDLFNLEFQIEQIMMEIDNEKINTSQ